MLADLGGEPVMERDWEEYSWLEGRLKITRATLSATESFLLDRALEVAGMPGGQAVIAAIGAATLRNE